MPSKLAYAGFVTTLILLSGCTAILEMFSKGSKLEFSDISSTGMTVRWKEDAALTESGQKIQYKLIYSSANNVTSLTDAESNGTTGMDWTEKTFSASLASLSEATRYYFAVLVKDEAGKVAVYTTGSQSTLDITGPTTGSGLVFSSVTGTAMTVSWGAATDNGCDSANLQYKLVQSSSANISTASDAETNGTVLLDWTAATLTYNVASLSELTTYHFNVLVKDPSGNISAYTASSQITPDGTAPTPGTGISFSSISATGMTVSWGHASDNSTAQASLKYKLVRSLSNNISSVTAAEANGTTVLNWTANTVSANVISLTDSVTYYFNVLVQDGAGNTTAYGVASQSTVDATAPVAGSGLTFSGNAATSITVTWGNASDNVSSASNLQYKLVKASSSGAIDSVNEVDAITGGGLVMDWTSASVSKTVTGLTSSTEYWFAVLVRDEAGNKTLYTPLSTSTLDITPPTMSSGTLAYPSFSSTSVTLTWTAASDDITSASALQYKVVRATATTDLDTVAKADAATTVADWSYNITTATASSLTASTDYAFNVVVKDAAGNKSIYTPSPRSTRPWSMQANLHASNYGQYQRFGFSVGLHNNTAIITSPYESSSETAIRNGTAAPANTASYASGAAYVMFRTGSTWSEQSYLKAPNNDPNDHFGWSSAISGDTIVVGAIGESSNVTGVTNGSTASSDNSTNGSGAAYVFVRSGANWSQQAYLKASTADSYINFGQAVAVSGDTIAVAAPYEGLFQYGAVYIFVRSGTTWSLQQRLTAAYEGHDYHFGETLAIDGDTLVVASSWEGSAQSTVTNGTTVPNDNSSGHSGAVYVFTRSGSTWTQQAFLKPSNNAEQRLFGASVAISGDTIAVGAPGSTSAYGNAAYIFTRSGSNWSQQATLSGSNSGYANFGCSVGVSGDLAVVGACSDNSSQATISNGSASPAHGTTTGSGAAYVFSRASGIWSQEALLKSATPAAADWWGSAAAIAGNSILIGASLKDNGSAADTGFADIITRP